MHYLSFCPADDWSTERAATLFHSLNSQPRESYINTLKMIANVHSCGDVKRREGITNCKKREEVSYNYYNTYSSSKVCPGSHSICRYGAYLSTNLAIKLQSWEHRAPTFQYSMVFAKASVINEPSWQITCFGYAAQL